MHMTHTNTFLEGGIFIIFCQINVLSHMALIVFIINIFRDQSYRSGWVGGNIDGGPLK